MLFRLALLSPPYATLTYSAPAWLPAGLWRPGLRVAVPLGAGAARAAVLLEECGEESSPREGVKVRDMLWPLESFPLLTQEYLDMIRELASRQLSTPGRILGTVLPRGLRTTARIRVREFRPDGRPVFHPLRDLASLDSSALLELGRAFAGGRAEVLALGEDAAAGEGCRLTCEPPWAVRPNAARQRMVLDYLLEHGVVSRRRLAEDLPGSASALAALTRAGLVAITSLSGEEDGSEPQEELLPPPSPPFELSRDQRIALDGYCRALDAAGLREGGAETHLLFGVTGSGKTAVYLELARACLERGRSALLLAPEVALALKLRRDAASRFPEMPVFLFHGYQSPPARERTFRILADRARIGSPCLVVGTRSALFLPLPSLGAIVLDEEHDSSFKQDEGMHYQAKEVAWYRASRHQALLVLGSATPDIKTFYAARQGTFPLARLPRRVGGGALPAIELVDIRESASDSLLAPASREALRETVKRGEQAVVLLNRRGYAPLMYCLDCGTVARCPRCDIGLTYHKRREQMVCHYCGYTRPFPSPCTACRGIHFLPMGEGTERLEEQLAGRELAGVLPPGGRVLRLDRDSTRRPGRMEEILSAFARGEAQVLVGTQMLSKGHHFPQVTLALIADADLGLNLPDYRAAERTFQLLIQSAGRAGRGEKPGRVLIQTRDTRHYCWRFVEQADYEGFYEHEIALREKRRYPPFVKLALARASFPPDWKEGPVLLDAFSSALRAAGREAGVTVMGPAPAPLARLQGRLRFQYLLKAGDWRAVRTVYSGALRTAIPGTAPREWRSTLDLDPVNML